MTAADGAMDSDLVLQAIGVLKGSRAGATHDELESRSSERERASIPTALVKRRR